jgi:hypothetical protein
MMRHAKVTIGALIAVAGLGVGLLVAAAANASGSQAFISYACQDSTGTNGDAANISADLGSLQQGGTLLLSGVCNATSVSGGSAIAVPAGVTLEGTGGLGATDGTVIAGTITETAGQNMGPVVIRGLQVDCGGSGTGVTSNGWDVTIEYVQTTDCVNGIQLDNPSDGTGNHVNDQINHNLLELTGTTGYGFYVDDVGADGGNGVTDGHFDDNYISGGLNSIEMLNAAGWFIDDNHPYGESGIAIVADRMFGTQISGNYLPNWTGYGIEGTVQSAAVASVVADNNVLQDPEGTVGGTTDPVGTGISLTANASTNCYVAVTGNTVISTNGTSSSYGIYGSGAGLTFASSGNLVEGVPTANESFAANGAKKTSGV